MFYFPIKKTGSSALSTSTTSGSWTYSDYIELKEKWYDGKHLYINCIVSSAGVTSKLNLGIQVAPTRGASYRFIGSGTSMSFKGTTTGSPAGDNKYFFPIVVNHGGVTEPLTNPGCLKLAYRAQRRTGTTFTAQLVIG